MYQQKPDLKNTMEYNGYIGTVQYSGDDELLFGKIWGIRDNITYEGSSVPQLKVSFQEAVDDYLALCKELGKEPQRAYKGSFNVRIAPALHKKATLEAEKRGVSLNQLVEESIADYLCPEKK